MKCLLLAGAALLLAPAPVFAQTAPSTTNGIPNTPLSTSTEPSNGPRARQGDLPSNNAAATMGGGMQAAPTVTVQTDPSAPPPVAMSPSPSQAFPAPAPMAQYPLCSAGQFDQCMEPGNGGGARSQGMRRRHRHHRR